MKAQTEKLQQTIRETNYLTGASEPPGGWAISTGVSAMTDAPRYSVSTRSQEFEGRYGATIATLTVRCDEGETAVVIDWDEYLGTGEQQVQLRIDDGPAFEAGLMVSSGGKAVGWWEARIAVPMIHKMIDAKLLVARIFPYGEDRREARFDIENLEPYALQVAAKCGWTLELPKAATREQIAP